MTIPLLRFTFRLSLFFLCLVPRCASQISLESSLQSGVRITELGEGVYAYGERYVDSKWIDFIDSDVPVSFLRVPEKWYSNHPLGKSELHIVVKSDCIDDYSPAPLEPNVTLEEGSLVIRASPPSPTMPMPFLEPSSFEASWECSGWIKSKAPSATASVIISWTVLVACTMSLLMSPWFPPGNVGRSTALLLVTVVVLVIAASSYVPSASSHGVSSQRWLQEEQTSCTVNVEILYQGCFDWVLVGNVLNVTAPAVRVLDFTPIRSEEEYYKDQGKHFCSAPFQFPYTDQTTDCEFAYNGYCGCGYGYGYRYADGDVSERSEEDGNTTLFQVCVSRGSYDGRCEYFVNGRPFRDVNGYPVVADTHVDDEPVWSAMSPQLQEVVSRWSRDSGVAIHRKESLGSEWTRRAVGEHASIASFAAFTIALMSNQAPPDLIRDALHAALDELEHATTSFEMASLLSGRHTEPGALAPSKHSFDRNLTALALGAAIEGCIEETLSALELAAEVEEAVGKRGSLDDVSSLLADKTRKIALEEGKHSALAWRTIHWVCNTNKAVCDAVKEEVLHPSHLAGAGRTRFASRDNDDAAKAWTRIYETLLPLATMAVVSPPVVAPEQALSTFDCTVDKTAEIDDNGGLIWALVNNIIRGVQCDYKTGLSADE
jgi:hypothetical protein